MKRFLYMTLALCLAFTGCQGIAQTKIKETESSVAETPQITTEAETAEQTPEAVTEESVEETVEETAGSETTAAGIIDVTAPQIGMGEDVPAGNVEIGETGRIRLDYTGNRDSVQYVTEASAVQAYAELAGYDAAYFENRALLLVIVTETSGSVQTEIASIQVTENMASVYVRRSMEGDVGTADMATWLLWAEVETGLDYQWSLGNAIATEDNVSRY